MQSLSYFVALLAAGSVILLLLLGPWLSVFPELQRAPGLVREPEGRKVLAYVVLVTAWTVALASWWWRQGRLVPRAARAGRSGRLRLGHVVVATGHGVVAVGVLFNPMAALLTSPLLVTVACYAVGAFLIESSRSRAEPPP